VHIVSKEDSPDITMKDRDYLIGGTVGSMGLLLASRNKEGG